MNTEQLKQAALKATPGPWRYWVTSKGARVAGHPKDNSKNFVCDVLVPEQAVSFDDNASYIAAANPTTILALLECVDALQSAVYHAGSPHEWKEQARAALQKLEAL